MTVADLAVSLVCGISLGISAAMLLAGVKPRGRDFGHFNRFKEKRLERRLPEMLERIASGLSAGHSLQQSLESVTRPADHPLAPIFSQVLTRMKAGQSLDEALVNVAGLFQRRSIPLALHSMAAAHRSGANLVESLHLLARISRDREALRGKIAAMSAQGRLQGIVLCMVPLLFLGGLFLVSPQSLFPVLRSPLGRKILLLSLALQAIGAAFIFKMVHRETF
ncbi:MAG: hypothetical protein GXP52_01805 [Deltaproteobacteria bacterium]|nr:hypothetical protein [Deltaproteobacteria bacterium]